MLHPRIWAVGAALLTVAVLPSAASAATAVPLGTAGGFAVLAGSGITNTGSTTLTGDIGTFPTTTITGAGGFSITGVNHGGDAVTQLAKPALQTGFNNAAGQGPPIPIVADLGGQLLVPGVYESATSIGLTGAVTLNGGGDPDAVFVFKAGSTLTTASASTVNLVNGTQACNVFWQIGSSATLGTGSTFRGSILADDSITVTNSVTIFGRALALNGAVTLDNDTITRPLCASAPPPPPVPTPTPTPDDTTTASATAADADAAAAAAASAQTAATAQAVAASKAASDASAAAAAKATAAKVAADKKKAAAAAAKKRAIAARKAADKRRAKAARQRAARRQAAADDSPTGTARRPRGPVGITG